MSNPSFSNIDLWLFELAEGNLTPEQIEQLEMFLLRNPELDVDRDVWEMAKVEKQVVVYPDMASLERKRRPVAAFAILGCLLLIAGTTSYFVWNDSADADGTTQAVLNIGHDGNQTTVGENRKSDPIETSEQTEGNSNRALLQTSITYNSSPELASQSQEIVSTTSQFRNNRRTPDNSNVRSTDPSLTDHENDGLLPSTVSQDVIEIATTDVDPANHTDQLDQNENDRKNEEINDATAQEYDASEIEIAEIKRIQRSSESDPFGGSKWNPNRSNSSPNLSAVNSNYRKPSFKDRLSTFSRNLDRMMSAPIALKNSRDPHYHVPGLTSSDISFSSAGTLVATRVQMTSRVQWLGHENEQFMNQISADGYSLGMRGGWGIQLNHQWYNNGGIQVGQVAFTYSPKISVSRWISVEPSIRMKMGNKHLNADQLSDAEMVEIDRGNEQEFYPNGGSPIGRSLWYKDLGLGMLVNTRWFFAGIQLDNLFKHNDNLYDNDWSDPRRAQNYFTATVGSDWISRNEKLKFSPYIVYQKNDRLSEAWAGANLSWNWLSIGAATSTNLEPAASLGIKFDHFSLMYNVDYTQSRMLNEKSLSHQITMRFVGKGNKFGKQLFKQ